MPLSNLKSFYFPFILLTFIACSTQESEVQKGMHFSLMKTNQTNIDFSNDLPYTEAFNTYTYRNFYNGGGVALGDINNDGLLDIYFSGNIEANKLYLNLGNWKFEDITTQAGVACEGVWSTGVNFVDINADGWLDLYVCKAGKPGGENRHNELFINQKDNTFREASKDYGLDITGLSIHSAFFDYDKDGDLDCYLLNNSIRSVGGFDFKEGLREIPDAEGNKFFKNENGKFIEVTAAVGMYSSNIGYGLGITLADFNQDSWTDVFISNDFFERDYLYLNNQDGTFKEVAAESFASLSMGSMGADACDINNDLLPDLFVTEMLPTSLERKKSKAQYEGWNKYSLGVKAGYHHQYSRNSLQRNVGQGQFMEIGRLAGVAATDWSWASLIQDFDNDGKRDLFISNGIFKDLLDKDYLNFFADDAIIKSKIAKKEKVLSVLIDSMPSAPVPNFLYKNLGDFQFESAGEAWGLADSTFSNGSAYGDLDNDGDLDLVINNANMPAYIYQNKADTAVQRSIQFELVGDDNNTKAIGTKIIIKYGSEQSMYEHYTSKGFQSSIENKILFGLGNHQTVDSVYVYWPNGKLSTFTNLATNQKHLLKATDAQLAPPKVQSSVAGTSTSSTFNFKHEDVKLNLFSRHRMLIEMAGFEGPALVKADLNQDGIEDVFIGGGKNQSNALFLSQSGGTYAKVTSGFEKTAKSEVVDAQFFDADADGDLDLYVAHGGSSFSKFAPELNDQLYINQGTGDFSLAEKSLIFARPIHTGAVAIADLNNDGKLDIVVAEKMKNNHFGKAADLLIYLNQGANKFEQLKTNILSEIGMISDVEIVDLNNDGWKDLIAVGKWMPVTIAYSDKGTFEKIEQLKTLANSAGLWNEIYKEDLDGDGDADFLLGNEGLNNFYKKDMRMYVNDFDKNGTAEQIVCEKIDNAYYPIHDIDEMFSQVPLLKKKFTFYNSFAKASIQEVFPANSLKTATKLDLEELKSGFLLNNDGTLEFVALPMEVQYSSTYAFQSLKTAKGNQMFLGGNNYRVKPQFGRQDASQGWQLDYVVENGKLRFSTITPLFIKGQIRSIENIGRSLLFGINNEEVVFYEID